MIGAGGRRRVGVKLSVNSAVCLHQNSTGSFKWTPLYESNKVDASTLNIHINTTALWILTPTNTDVIDGPESFTHWKTS